MNVVDAERFFIDQLKNDSRFADLDTSPTSNFHDLVIKPNLLLAQAVFNFVDYMRIGSSLDYFAYQTNTQLDALAGNYFVYRKGKQSVFVEYTLYFENSSSANLALQVSPSDLFKTSDGIEFATTQEYYFVPSALPLETINGVSVRVARFPLKSDNATRKVLTRELVVTPLSHPALILSTNLSDSSDPVLEETNLQVKARMINGLATRNLVSSASVAVTLTETFPIISDTYAIGYGDPEMQRDIAVAGKCWSYHAGGMIDVYTRTPLKPTSFQVTGSRLPNQNAYRIYLKRYKGYDLSGSDKSNPHPSLLYGWEQVELPDNAYMRDATVLPELPLLFVDTARELSATSLSDPNLTLGWSDMELTETHVPRIEISSIEENHRDYRFSIYEQLAVDLYFLRNIGDIVTFSLPYWTIDSIESIQQFVSESSTRFQCANTIVKSFIPVEITSLTIVYDKNYVIDQAALTQALTQAINTWILPEPIRLSELLKNVGAPVRLSESGRDFALPLPGNVDQSFNLPPSYYANYSGPTFVETKQHNIDGTTIHSYSTREIGLTENAALSASKRTIRYFVEPSRIKFVPKSW